jgi:hypothetical protein
VRFLKERWIGRDLRVAEKLEAVFAFIRLLECDLKLRLKFRA